MGAYFVLALSIPNAFDGAGLAFGVAYLLVVVMHTALFTRATVASAVKAILALARYNLLAALRRARRRRASAARRSTCSGARRACSSG